MYNLLDHMDTVASPATDKHGLILSLMNDRTKAGTPRVLGDPDF